MRERIPGSCRMATVILTRSPMHWLVWPLPLLKVAFPIIAAEQPDHLHNIPHSQQSTRRTLSGNEFLFNFAAASAVKAS